MDMALRIALFVALSAVPTLLAWHDPGGRRRAGIRASLGVAMILVTLVYNLYYFSPARFQPGLSLPLQVCDLLGFAAILSLTTSWRMPRVLLLLSALPFVAQAVFTPVGEQHPTALRTWLYWGFHGVIFATFLFELRFTRLFLHWRDLAGLFLLDLAYVGAISLLNIGFGWNYGYIGNASPEIPTVVALLGPWPGRIAVMTGLAMLLQTICFFLFARRIPRT